ncbi:PIR Superfamily Protein [Plasmodium malariae]|uniref:PIR Superfamily Protein n=1 Tax=Plasmodium malariae TaxID=5858 RepID=A0A1A8WMI7_PLAMA|nr:PIR Superfamily Protein [Plasmodium malariae]
MEKLTEELLNKILEGSRSSNIYNILNQSVTGNQYDTICKELNENESGNNNPTGSYNLCKQIARNAQFLSYKINESGYKNYCLHYTYWVYYKIKKILESSSESNKSELLTKFLKLNNTIYKHYNLYNCLYAIKGNSIEGLNDKVDEKHLFDYFKNYDYIKKYDTCNKFNFSKYKNYLNHINELYKKHKTEKKCCEDLFWSDCPDYFYCQNEFDPNTLLQALNSNESDKCKNLKKLEKTTQSGYLMDSEDSQTDIISSFYFTSCTDIKGDSPNNQTRTGGIQKCNVFAASPKSLNSSSPFTQPPPDYVTFNFVQQTIASAPSKLREKKTESSENSEQVLSYHLEPIIKKQVKITKIKQVCKKPGLVNDASGSCREPSVRETGAIGLKLDSYHPDKKRAIISFINNPINIFNNNVFRGGIAFTLIVGIISTIYIYYKFTPFGRRFHKKEPRKKRIDNYYDDPYMRQFIIRAPKPLKRKVGTARLHFSYYST